MEQRYYYKSKEGHLFNFKRPSSNESLIEITEQEFNFLKAPAVSAEEHTAKAERRQRIAELKQKLSDSDYQAIKYAEGLITEEEYAPIKTQRQSWRNEINELEEELK